MRQRLTPRIVCTAADIDQKWAGIPGIELTPGGRLYIVFYSGGDREPTPENMIYMVISEDDGETFSTPKVLVKPRDGMRAFDPTLWMAPAGVLWLIFNRSNKETAEHGVYARICGEPDANNPEWSEEFRVG